MQSNDILSMIGNTPLVELKRLSPRPGVKILAKLESKNPGGSIKDRVALSMIEAAEKSGEMAPGKTIIEATSGNTGIGLCMVAAVKGYPIMLLMSELASEERKMIMRAYGAELKFTPGHMSTDGAIEEAYRMAREEPEKYVLMDQFNNPASIDAHYRGTGMEIWEQTGGEITHFIGTLGTSGTVMGCTKRLKEMNPAVRCIAVEPHAGHKIQGLKNMHESYPPGIYDKSVLDEVIHVDDAVAFEYCRRLAKEEGIFAGMSSGAAIAGAVQIAEGLESGVVVTIFPDSGERYLSTPLFAPKDKRGMRVHDVASNGLTHLEEKSGGLSLYTTGPSLDRPGDLRAYRRMVILDLMARFRAERGQETKVGVGLADLDDRTLAAAREAGLTRAEHVEGFLKTLTERAAALGIRGETVYPLASDSVERSLDVCRRLLAKGQGYEKLRSVYFDVARDRRYGQVAHVDPSTVDAGKTVDLDAYVKDSPMDFTLLKRATLLDLKLDDVVECEWGKVRPSWFLQLATAGVEGLGRVDVFLAKDSHRFPHLDNFRALWTAQGNEVLAWMTARGVQSEAGEPLDFAEVVKLLGHERALRMWLLSSSYRKPLAATGDSLSMWSRNWRRVQEGAALLKLTAEGRTEGVPEAVEQGAQMLRNSLTEAMEDDLALHRFWPTMFRFLKDANGLIARGELSAEAASLCFDRLRGVDHILGVIDHASLPLAQGEQPGEVVELVARREQARREKDFAEADRLREELARTGYVVEDAPGGTRVFRGK